MAKEISLKELLFVMRKRLWVIILATILVTMAGYLYGMSKKPVPLYQSSTRILIGANANNMSTLEVLIEDPSVLDKVSQKVNSKRSSITLKNEIHVSSINSSQIVSISVIDQDPKLAAEIANTTAKVFKSQAASIMNFTNVQLLTKAEIHPAPINPADHHKIIIGFILGLVIGIGLAFFLNSVDDTVQSEQELKEILESPILGSISKMNRKNMYKRRKTNHLQKGLIEFPNVLKLANKKRKWTFKKPGNHQNHNMVHKKSESVQRAHH